MGFGGKVRNILYAQRSVFSDRGEPNFVMLPSEETEALDLAVSLTASGMVRVPLTWGNREKLHQAGYQILMAGAD